MGEPLPLRRPDADAPHLRRPRADVARVVADLLRQQIHSGTYPEGLPAETELAGEFGVSRNTVRESLALLKNEGLIARAPKIGTRIAQRKLDHALFRLTGLQEALRGHGEVHNHVRTAVTAPAPPTVARRLQLQPGTDVVYIERLRYLDDLPLSLDLTYLAPDIGHAVLEHDLASNDIFAVIEQVCRGPLESADIRVEAVAADSHSAAMLQVPESAPLLLLERLTRLDGGRPVDLEFVRMRGDRISLRGTLARTPSTPTEESSHASGQ